jgi:hypothetical protein
MVANLFTNGDTDLHASAACRLALAQQMRRYQVSRVQLKVAVGSQGGERSRRDAHTPVCARRGRGTGEAVISLASTRPGKERARAHACPRGDRMTIRQLRDLLATMDPDGEAFVTLFHADGSAETFAIEEVTDTHGEAHIEISDEEPAA